ncbi:MAG: PAS domain-containing protein [Janthinobacterium lividum]
MDTTSGFEDGTGGATAAADDEAQLAIGTDERRMHVRAYNHWVSLLHGRAYPSIEDLDPAGIADFGPHSVLLDFSRGVEDPAIQFLGRSLREECALDPSITRIADVPSRSLLSRLTDHYLQIIANRAPIGFEAEFVGTRGFPTLYRGILMPFSSDGDAIDFIYGVINWKELADAATQAGLAAELQASIESPARTGATADTSVWADGPSAGDPEPLPPAAPLSDDDDAPTLLADRLVIARESAAAVRAADTRSRAALYRALGRAHDFAIAAFAEPEVYARLLIDSGIGLQVRAPMTPLVKLIFGADYDKTRLTEFASVLAAARVAGIGPGALGPFIDAHPGGIKGVVQAARAARAAARPAPRPRPPARSFADRPSLAHVELASQLAAGAPVLLVARAGEGGMEIVGTVADELLLRRALAAIG